jgi:DNA transformation protein
MDGGALREIFQEVGPIRIRRMFGGQGIYSGDVIFAIEVRGEIYLKGDAEIRPLFEAAGSRPFTYEREGRRLAMGYWLMPEDALDDPAEAARWARLAIGASRRAAGARPAARRP